MSAGSIPSAAVNLSLFDQPETEDKPTKNPLSAAQVQAEIVTMLQHLDDPASSIFRNEFTTIYRRLKDVTTVEEVNTIVSKGILNIVNGLGANSQVDYLVQLMYKLSQPAPQKHAYPLEQQSWGWLS